MTTYDTYQICRSDMSNDYILILNTAKLKTLEEAVVIFEHMIELEGRRDYRIEFRDTTTAKRIRIDTTIEKLGPHGLRQLFACFLNTDSAYPSMFNTLRWWGCYMIVADMSQCGIALCSEVDFIDGAICAVH